MNVAIFIANISRIGGTEVIATDFASRLLELNNKVFFIVMDFNGAPKELECKNVVYYPLNREEKNIVLSKKQIEDALMFCKEKSIEYAQFILNLPHKIDSPMSNLSLILGMTKICKVDVAFHNSPRSYLRRYKNPELGFVGYSLRKLKTVFYVAPYAKKFIRTLANNNVRIFTLSHGCQREMKKYYGVDSVIRYNPYKVINLELPIKKNIVIYCGRLVRAKNNLLLLKAWNFIKSDGWILRYIGDGEQIDMLKNFCRKNNLQNVEFLGGVPHSKIYDYMAESKILCLTSFNEGFPTVMVEAMNMGNAIITTKYDGISDELLDIENSIITSYSVKAYANAISKLISNEDLVKKMGIAARKKINSFYVSDEYLQNNLMIGDIK